MSVESLNTLWLALASALIGLLLALAFVLAERQARTVTTRGAMAWSGLAVLPLLIPQMTLIPALLLIDLNGLRLPPWMLALWGHVMFTAAYGYLTLRGPIMALDPRYRQVALALGRPRWQALLLVELPILLRPIMASLAIGLSVSGRCLLVHLDPGSGTDRDLHHRSRLRGQRWQPTNGCSVRTRTGLLGTAILFQCVERTGFVVSSPAGACCTCRLI